MSGGGYERYPRIISNKYLSIRPLAGVADWVSFPPKTISPECHFPRNMQFEGTFPPNALFPQKRAN